MFDHLEPSTATAITPYSYLITTHFRHTTTPPSHDLKTSEDIRKLPYPVIHLVHPRPPFTPGVGLLTDTV